ncbi:PglL family O-oligosaccharyltransferase [Hydrogenophaga crocea]|uniref:Virulence factor membrane-bound polymerase C-terminal domain-containing protein n=1 Tax=Hydrogenophaga crocea TaxID=2716225 RepID=A0A6G8IKD5_9BURK|nr:O-antigen ligase family protein [Hydrogenophaga crocea]QIM53702.1 hypothetical protein G9Q37_16840 [Hydrogenophaga crocea]
MGPFFMRNLRTPLWTPLATALLSLAWLLPNAHPPWVAFQKDALAASVLLACAIPVAWKAFHARVNPRLDPLSLCMLGLALLTLLQWVGGQIEFFGHASVGALYWIGGALALMLGSMWARWAPDRFLIFLFSAFLVGAVATAGLMLVQWLGLNLETVWIAEAVGGRPYGNLIQPNNAASLLLLGFVAVWWLRQKGNISFWPAMFATAYLLFGVAISGSRIGFLSLTLLLLVVIGSAVRRSELRLEARTAGAILVGFWLTVLLLNSFSDSVTSIGDVRAHALGRDLANIRLVTYLAFLDAALEGPLWGYGFDQAIYAQKVAQQLGHDVPMYFKWTHNALLDLAVWYGPVVGALTAVLLGWWVYRVARSQWSVDLACCLAGLVVLGLHGLVELPLAYAYFLLPACLLAGYVTAQMSFPIIDLPVKSFLLGLLAASVCLGLVFVDYFKVESSYYAWRFKQARIGINHPYDVPETIVLNQFRALLVGLRGDAGSLNSKELDDFKFAVMLQPSPVALVHLAAIQARSGMLKEAQETADVANTIYPAPFGDPMRIRWQEMAAADQRLKPIRWSENILKR